MVVRCKVKGCRRNARRDKDHHFFEQPQNPELRRKWQEFAQVEGCASNLRICSDHFEPKCFRKKYPRPLLTPGAIPTILPIRQPLQDKQTNINQEQTVELQRAALQDGCSHNSDDIFMEITKATEDNPAIIEIQTNNKICVIVKGDKNSTNKEQSSLPDATSTLNNLSCTPPQIESSSLVPKHMTAQTSATTSPTSCTLTSVRMTTPKQSEINTITGTPAKKATSCTPKLLRLKAPKQLNNGNMFETPTKRLPHVGKLARHILLTPKTLRLNTQRRTIAQLRSKIHRLNKRRKNVELAQRHSNIESIVREASKFLSKEAHSLFATHLRLSNVEMSRRRYNDEFKDIALSIKYHSPKAYKFLRKIINLPSERTLCEYQKKFPIYPGLNHTILNQLKTNFQDVPIQDKIVSILFDEINLTPEIHFDSHSDSFKGIIDDGITREPKEARSALVAMITWINKPIKQVVGYWLLR